MHAASRLLPHALTLANLAAGCVACVALVRGEYAWVPWCLLVSAVADFLDGFAARAAGVQGPFGRELDSLADVVSFGVSPGLMAMAMLGTDAEPWAFLALLIPVFSAVRLARFNVAQSDTPHFIGLATPANTLLWFGLFMTWLTDAGGFRQNLSQPLLVLPLAALTAGLLVSNVSYFSNKLNPLAARNWPVWVVAAAFVGLPWLLGWAAVPIAVGLYVLSGFVWKAP